MAHPTSHCTQEKHTHTLSPSQNMRTFSALLAAAILAPVAVLGKIAADAQKAVQDITSVLHPIGEEDGATKALETLKLKVDAKGCYHLTGPDSGLSLLLCEDDAGARKRYTDEGESWGLSTLVFVF